MDIEVNNTENTNQYLSIEKSALNKPDNEDDYCFVLLVIFTIFLMIVALIFLYTEET